MSQLALLSSIVTFGRQSELLSRLRAAADAQGIFDLLKEINVVRVGDLASGLPK